MADPFWSRGGDTRAYIPSHYEECAPILAGECTEEKIIAELQFQNHYALKGANIANVQPLIHRTNKGAPKHASLAIDLLQANAANNLALSKTSWPHKEYKTTLYAPGSEFRQCELCSSYDRLDIECDEEIRCRNCAEPHETATCPMRRVGRRKFMCAVCGLKHNATSGKCDSRQREVSRMLKSRRKRMLQAKVSQEPIGFTKAIV